MKLRSCSRRQSHLPEDLIVEIIRKLPLKYMVQLRCVNKSWYRLIGTSSFIKSTIANTNNHWLLCSHDGFYTLTDLSAKDEDDINTLKYYNTPKLYGVNDKHYNPYDLPQFHGICNGLLCFSDPADLQRTSRIYLWNPIIRKAKSISMIPPPQLYEEADLCFGYFHDDYKVIRIAPCWDAKKFRVGVYSLSTDTWKVTYGDGAYGTDTCKPTFFDTPINRFSLPNVGVPNKLVGGVAYFVRYRPTLICFDLYREVIREVQFPDEFGRYLPAYSMEPCGESIALIGTIQQQYFTKWVLRNCAATNTSTWEKIVILKLKTQLCFLRPLGFAKHGKYLVRKNFYPGDKYWWDFERSSHLEECTSYTWIKDPRVKAIGSLVGNLVLLDEKTLDPFVETEPCSTQTIFELHKLPSLRVEKRTHMLDTTRERMKGRSTNRRIEHTDIDKPRNRLQGRGTKRRKEDTKMETPRKKERKEMLGKTQNVLQGTGAKGRMEETEMEKPRKKKGRKKC